MNRRRKKYQRIIIMTVFGVLCMPNCVFALVNVNTADKESLLTVPKIGEVTADNIISYRNTNGDIESLAKLCSLYGKNGISESTKTCQTIGENVSFSGGGGVEISSAENDNSASEKNTSDDEEDREPIDGLLVYMPKVGFTGQTIDFSVEPKQGTDSRLVRYTWNFGDGMTSNRRSSTHSYENAGTYVVTVESYYLKEYKTARKQITIVPVDLQLEVNDGSQIYILNNAKQEIDLSNMKLVGQGEFIFPKYSIVLPGEKMNLPTGVVGDFLSYVSLFDEEGKVVALWRRQAEAVLPPVAASSQPASVSTVMPRKVQELPATTSASTTSSSTISKTVSTPLLPTEPKSTSSLPYVGLVGVLGLSWFALFNKSGML